MTRVDLDLAFNYHVKHSGDGDTYAAMRSRDVDTDVVYVDHTDDGCLFGVQTAETSIGVYIDVDQIPKLVEELEEHAPEDYDE